MNKPCHRRGCQEPAEEEITLEGGQQEQPRTFFFCMDHYLEALTIAEMIRRLTGIPEIRTEQEAIP